MESFETQRIDSALRDLTEVPAQTGIPVMAGISLRRAAGGVLITRIHYSANPERNPEINPEWKANERSTYTSQADWDREQEIIDEAGGGELVFADVLVRYWDKIIISDPAWKADPRWRRLGGFDHGKTNPTALEGAYVDFDGNIIFSGEYYVPGKQVWEHAPALRAIDAARRFETCFGDPSVFDQKTNQEKDSKEPKAIATLYEDEGVKFIKRFYGNRNNQTFCERVLAHWGDLEHREPSLRIVCKNYTEPPKQPQPGYHDSDCPNLLWELMRTRRRKLTAQQLMAKNASEEIIDKDDHARDCMKYVVMSLPEPTRKAREVIINEKIEAMREAGVDQHSLYVHRVRMEMDAKKADRGAPTAIGSRRIPKVFRRS